MRKKVSALENQIAGYIESQADQDAATLQRLSDSHWQAGLPE